MSVQKYPGRVLSKTPPTITPPVDGEGGSAPGVWTLSEALENQKAGTWPKPPLPRELYTWGSSSNGQLGHNNRTDLSSPVQVGALTTWTQVSASNKFTSAIKTDGTLWAWGLNNNGQLGFNDTVARSSPVQVGALTTWYQVSEGNTHTAAVKTDGTMWSWGSNGYGKLGLGDTISRSSPVQIGALTTWSQVSAGNSHTGALKPTAPLDVGQSGKWKTRK
jgi:alpha-tubulin suppressor-like RCC1 family protein